MRYRRSSPDDVRRPGRLDLDAVRAHGCQGRVDIDVVKMDTFLYKLEAFADAPDFADPAASRSWDQDRAELERLWLLNRPADEIARRINRTLHAVLWRAHRLDLPKRAGGHGVRLSGKPRHHANQDLAFVAGEWRDVNKRRRRPC